MRFLVNRVRQITSHLPTSQTSHGMDYSRGKNSIVSGYK
jgi:hypothetical protein